MSKVNKKNIVSPKSLSNINYSQAIQQEDNRLKEEQKTIETVEEHKDFRAVTNSTIFKIIVGVLLAVAFFTCLIIFVPQSRLFACNLMDSANNTLSSGNDILSSSNKCAKEL